MTVVLELFDSLVVRDGVAPEYVPREDCVAEVILLMDAVVGSNWRSAGRDGFQPA